MWYTYLLFKTTLWYSTLFDISNNFDTVLGFLAIHRIVNSHVMLKNFYLFITFHARTQYCDFSKK